MASFSEANFAKKLQDLNASQQSIQTLSLWLIHHRKHSASVVEIWIKELKKAKDPRKLTFLYLANDVVQNSKKKGPEYGRDFKLVLPEAYKHVSKHVPEKTRQSMGRLIDIWKERQIFDPATLGAMRRFLDQGDQSEDPGSSGDTPNTPEVQVDMLAKMKQALGPKGDAKEKHKHKGRALAEAPARKKKKQDVTLMEEIERELEENSNLSPPQAEKLVKALEDLENSASSDAQVREQIAALPPEVSDISMLDKLQDKEEAEQLARTVESACILLSDYNARLTSELEERKQVALMLRTFITSQKEALTAAEEELAEHKAKLRQVSSLRKELKVHIQSLPDMTLLPNVTGLAPLPSAGDLFAAFSGDHEG